MTDVVVTALAAPRGGVDGGVAKMLGEVRVTSSTGGSKGKKLAQFSLLPPGPLRRVAEHYGKGGLKYGDPRNWEKGYEWSLSYDALLRHLLAWWSGEDYDPESPDGRSEHLAAVVFHALALMEWRDTHPEFDNRPNSTKTSPLESELQSYLFPMENAA